jgi:hypothetical protein
MNCMTTEVQPILRHEGALPTINDKHLFVFKTIRALAPTFGTAPALSMQRTVSWQKPARLRNDENVRRRQTKITP